MQDKSQAPISVIQTFKYNTETTYRIQSEWPGVPPLLTDVLQWEW